MTSLRGSLNHRFGQISVVVVTSFIIASSVFVETTAAGINKRDSDERIFIDLLESLIEYEEAKASEDESKFTDTDHQQEVNLETEASSKLSTASSTCGVPAISPNVNLNTRIIGGVEAKPHSWPWQCSVQYGVSGDYIHACGCSVTSNRKVCITAAHCVANLFPLTVSNLQVVCGDHNIMKVSDSKTQVVKVRKTIVHPKFGEPTEYNNDIAFLVLRTPLTFSATVSPVCIPSVNVPVGTKCVVTGWGDTNHTGNGNVLRQVVLPVFNQKACKVNNARVNITVTDNMLCAGYAAGGKNACQGDSGGPFVCRSRGKWYLQGIVSFGYGCGNPDIPIMYTRVVNYRSLIQSVINSQ